MIQPTHPHQIEVPAVWVEPRPQNGQYIVHRVTAPAHEPANLHSPNFRTACDRFPVPADEALFFNSHHRPNCDECRIAPVEQLR